MALSETTTYESVCGKHIDEMRSKVDIDIQALLIEASECQKLINEAKTQTKKTFYIKKFRKLQQMIIQSTYAISYLNQLQTSTMSKNSNQETTNNDNNTTS